MSSPSYEIYFRTATFENVSKLLCTFANYHNDKGQSSWTYPPKHEHFDILIEQDEEDWDEFIEDIELDFFDDCFEHKLPSCCLSIERRKWAGTRGYKSLAEILIKLLTNFDGLFATEQQLFTLDDLIRGLDKNPISDKTIEIVDYTAIKKTDDLLTRKRIAFGIREAMEIHCLSNPYFESGDEWKRRELIDEIIELGEPTIPVIAAWLESENNGLVNDSAEIIAKIGGIMAVDVLKKTAFESKVSSFAKYKTANELLRLVSNDEQLEIKQWIATQLHE